MMWNYGEIKFVSGFRTRDALKVYSQDFPTKTLGNERGLHIGNLLPHYITGSRTKASKPNVWKFLKFLLPLTPVKISFGLNLKM